MTDFNNLNRPHINHSNPPSIGDGSKKDGDQSSAEGKPQAEPAPVAYEKATPDNIFSALQAKGLSQQDKIAESRISGSLSGFPSPESFARFEAHLDNEFPGLTPLQKSDIAANYFAGSVVIKTA